MGQPGTTTERRGRWGSRILLLLVASSAVLHFGAAAFRIEALLPKPRAVDFASYYAGAWSMREGISPYSWSAGLLDSLQVDQGLPPDLVDRSGVIPGHNSPPPWAFGLVPLTLLSFPAASWLWLLFLLGLVGWCTVRLAGIAGMHDLRRAAALFPFVLTFGPVFLSIILGQNSLLLLAAALVVGPELRAPGGKVGLRPALLWVLAIAAKIFPAMWLGALVLQRRWQFLTATVVLTVVVFGGVWAAAPSINHDYWFDFLPNRVEGYSDGSVFGDQSLAAWLDRIGRPHTFQVHLFAPGAESVPWEPPWSLSTGTVQAVNLLLIALIGIGIVAVARRVNGKHDEGLFYLVVLFTLLAFPHMARYNLVLVLPAMAWLWRWAPGRYGYLIAAYILVGVARLMHPLVVALPISLGVLLSGAGVVAVLLLGAAVARTLVGLESAVDRSDEAAKLDWVAGTTR